MTMTERRLRRPAVGILTKQSAYGTIAEEFTLGADSIRVWSYELPTQPARDKSRPGPWMNQTQTEDVAGRYSTAEKSEGRIVALATPESVAMFLRSNWGPGFSLPPFPPFFPPEPTYYVLKRQVSEWFSLAWIESQEAGSPQRLIRLQDVFIHRLEFKVDRSDGRLVLVGDYAARRTPISDLDDLGPIVLPVPPAAAADTRVFNIRSIQLRRDPDGANVNVPFERLAISLDQRGVSEWTKSNGWVVYKGGKTFAGIGLDGMLCDETWKLIDDNVANTREKFRFTSTAPATVDHPTAVALTIDLPEVDFNIQKVGHDEKSFIDFKGAGRALKSGTGDFVTISLL